MKHKKQNSSKKDSIKKESKTESETDTKITKKKEIQKEIQPKKTSKNHKILLKIILIIVGIIVLYAIFGFITGLTQNNDTILSNDSNNLNKTDNQENLTQIPKIIPEGPELIFNKEESKETFYFKINQIREENGEYKLSISQSLERKTEFCSSHQTKDYECLTENNQIGLEWQIPWHKNVCEKSYVEEFGETLCTYTKTNNSNCLGNENNINCFIESIKNINYEDKTIYELLLETRNGGIGMYFDEDNNRVNYNLILQ